MSSLKEEQKKAVRPEGIGSNGEHDNLDTHPERREAEVDDLENLKNQESRADEDRNTKPDSASQTEQDELPSSADEPDTTDDEGSGWDNKVKGKKKGKTFEKRWAILGVSSGLLVGLGIGFSVFLSGPLKIIHAAMLLKQFHSGSNVEFSSRRMSKLLRYSRVLTGGLDDAKVQDYNLSRAGNKLAIHYEKALAKQGIGFEYEHGSLKRIVIDPSTETGNRLKNNLEEKHGVGLKPDPADGKIKLEFSSNPKEITDIGNMRIAVGDTVEATTMGKVNRFLASRLLKKRGNMPSMFHPIERLKAELDNRFWANYDEWKTKKNAEIDERVSKGSVDPEIKKGGADDAGDGQTQADDIAKEVGEIEKEVKVKAPLREKAAALKAKLSKPAGILAFAGILCGLDALGEGVAKLQDANVVLPSIRLAMSMVVTPASQIMRGEDLTALDIGVIADKYFDEVEKTDFFDAESVQYNLGNPDTGVTLPDSAKPGKNRPLLFEIIHNIVSGAKMSTVCSAINSGIGQIFLSVGDLVLAALSGGGSFAVSAGMQAGTFVLGEKFGDDLVRVISGKIIDTTELKGGLFGAVADSGKFLSENNSMMAMGGRTLTQAENLALVNENSAKIKEEYQRKPVYARLFDIKDPRSLVSSTLIDNSKLQNPQVIASSLASNPFKMFSYFSSSLSKLNPKTYAQTAPFDYGVAKVGFSIAERDGDITENPYDNERNINDALPELNEKYGKCFGTTINPETGRFTTTEAPGYIELEDMKDECGPENTDPDFLRYRMYLADTVLMATAICYNGIDETACADLDIGNAKAAQNNENDGVVNPNNPAKGVDTSAQQCTAGNDLGVKDSPTNGIKIRICSVGGMGVNVAIENNVKTMLADARAAGINLSGGGFRSYQGQISVRKNNCGTSDYDIYQKPASQCRPPTARPGSSMHEWGLALDLSVGGSLVSSGSDAFNWLQANASKYGLKNLPSEAWHWSTTGT